MSKTPYLTTAIPYVNGAPHIGHALDYLQADVFFRYLQATGASPRLQAGTDEHGNKIFNKAQSLNIPVADYVAQNSAKFREFISRLNVSPTDFIRTTSPEHIARVQEIWRRLSPHIYSAAYEGWYCEGCERFVTDKEVEENSGTCPDHQKPYEKLSETNYYLRISDFKEQIFSALDSGEMKILPAFREKEMRHLLETSPDVSISRPRKNLSWGIPIPDDDSQVMYVWIDALSNYLTVLGYPEKTIDDFWPPLAQFVGKDILRFHAIIWPSILLGLGLPLPKTIVSHGHVLSNGEKMSKSLGNVVDPLEVLSRHGSEAFRYFFLRHVDTFTDSDFTDDKFESAYAKELANDLGNLVQRLAVLCAKNSVSLNLSAKDVKNLRASALADTDFRALMDGFEFSRAFDYAWEQVQSLNRRIDEAKPWALAKTDLSAAQSALASLATSLLSTSTLLAPFLPQTAERIFSIFTPSSILPPVTPLFPK